MITPIALLRSDGTGCGSSISRFIELLESRCLLSSIPAAALPAAGTVFNGSALLVVPAAPATLARTVPIQLTLNTINSTTLSGTESAIGTAPEVFTATITGRSFNGIFADGSGTIAGTFTGIAALTGTLSQSVSGVIENGTFNATVSGTQGAVLNFSQLGTGSAFPTTTPALAAPATTAAASTSVTTPTTPSNFLVSGTSTSDLSVNGTIAADAVVPGIAPNLLALTSTLTVLAPPALGLFSGAGAGLSTSSSFISIGNSGSTSPVVGAFLAIGPVGG